MGEEYEIVDRYGRPTGERAHRVGSYPGTNCLFVVLAVLGTVGLIFFGVWKLVSLIQSNALPVHNSLQNMQCAQSLGHVSSDDAGLHIAGDRCIVSQADYGAVDVTVSARLEKVGAGGANHAGYGIEVFSTSSSDSWFGITTSGKWFYNLVGFDPTGNAYGRQTSASGSSAAIHRQVGATNTLKIKRHLYQSSPDLGTNPCTVTSFVFVVNGEDVASYDGACNTDRYDISLFSGGPNPVIEGDDTSLDGQVVFTDLTIDTDA